MNDLTPATALAFLFDILPLLRAQINSIRTSGLNDEVKADGSWVTAADRSTEKKFRELVQETYPEHGVLGEEYGELNPDAEYRWVIDPIDGTAEFRAGMPEWGTVIGLFHKSTPIAGVIDCPDLEVLVSASKGNGTWLERGGEKKQIFLKDFPQPTELHKVQCGISPKFSFDRFGESRGALFHQLCDLFPRQKILHNCYLHTLVFSGSLDLSIESRMRLWDISSLQLLTEEAGGRFEVYEKYPSPNGEIYSIVYGQPHLVEQALNCINAKANS